MRWPRGVDPARLRGARSRRDGTAAGGPAPAWRPAPVRASRAGAACRRAGLSMPPPSRSTMGAGRPEGHFARSRPRFDPAGARHALPWATAPVRDTSPQPAPRRAAQTPMSFHVSDGVERGPGGLAETTLTLRIADRDTDPVLAGALVSSASRCPIRTVRQVRCPWRSDALERRRIEQESVGGNAATRKAQTVARGPGRRQRRCAGHPREGRPLLHLRAARRGGPPRRRGPALPPRGAQQLRMRPTMRPWMRTWSARSTRVS